MLTGWGYLRFGDENIDKFIFLPLRYDFGNLTFFRRLLFLLFPRLRSPYWLTFSDRANFLRSNVFTLDKLVLRARHRPLLIQMLAEAFRFFTWHFPLLNGKSGCTIFHIRNLALQILVCAKAVRCLHNVGSWRFYRSLLFLFIDDKLLIVGRILQLFKGICSLFALRHFGLIVEGESSGDW